MSYFYFLFSPARAFTATKIAEDSVNVTVGR